MIKILILLWVCCLLAVCSATNETFNKSRIFHGEDAEQHEFPFMVRIETRDGLICGGSLLSGTIVVTAANCMLDDETETWYLPDNLKVIAGDINIDEPEYREKVVKVKRVIRHPEYDKRYFKNDIALVFLVEDLSPFEVIHRPIFLPKSGTEYENYFYGEGLSVTVAGWGETVEGHPSTKLQKLNWPISNMEACLEYWNDYLGFKADYFDIDFCTGKLSTGKLIGDSGGPVFIRSCSIQEDLDEEYVDKRVLPRTNPVFSCGHDFILLGILSFGPSEVSSDMYTVNTKVSHYTDWIVGHLLREKEGDFELVGGAENEGVVVDKSDYLSSVVCSNWGHLNNWGHYNHRNYVDSAVCRRFGYNYGIKISPEPFLAPKSETYNQLINLPYNSMTNIWCPEKDWEDYNQLQFPKYCNKDDLAETTIPCISGDQLAVRCFMKPWVIKIQSFVISNTKFEEGGYLLKGSTFCSFSAVKYGKSLDPDTDLYSLLLLAKHGGEVHVLNGKTKYRKRQGGFTTKFKAKIKIQNNYDGCFVCLVSVKETQMVPAHVAFEFQGCGAPDILRGNVEDWIKSDSDRQPTTAPI